MIYVDTHTHHSPFSSDGGQTLAELIDSAVTSGLAGIMLTDHYDVDFPTPGNMSYTFDMDASFAQWQECNRNRQNDELAVHYGIELGYQPHLNKLCNELCSNRRFDGVILSLHLLNGFDPYYDTSLYNSGKISVYTAYLDALIDMIKAVPGPAIVGHFDYITRKAPFPVPTYIYAEMPDAFDRFLTAVIDGGKCLEVNIQSLNPRGGRGQHLIEQSQTSGLKAQVSGLHLPDPEILQRYIALGGRMVSLGSDAHKPGACGRWFPELAAYLAECGIRDLTHFVRGVPRSTPISY